MKTLTKLDWIAIGLKMLMIILTGIILLSVFACSSSKTCATYAGTRKVYKMEKPSYINRAKHQ